MAGQTVLLLFALSVGMLLELLRRIRWNAWLQEKAQQLTERELALPLLNFASYLVFESVIILTMSGHDTNASIDDHVFFNMKPVVEEKLPALVGNTAFLIVAILHASLFSLHSIEEVFKNKGERQLATLLHMVLELEIAITYTQMYFGFGSGRIYLDTFYGHSFAVGRYNLWTHSSALQAQLYAALADDGIGKLPVQQLTGVCLVLLLFLPGIFSFQVYSYLHPWMRLIWRSLCFTTSFTFMAFSIRFICNCISEVCAVMRTLMISVSALADANVLHRSRRQSAAK
eukprot:6201896-Pleurochrysis_carterae.AAC.6